MEFTFTDLPSLHPYDDWRIAVHESGHAVFAVKNDFLFTCVEIGPKEHGEVHVSSSPLDDDQHSPLDDDQQELTRDQLLCWQAFYAAGAAAEHLVFQEIRRHAVRTDENQHRRINEMCVGSPDLFESAIARALEVLSMTTIEHVAKQLMNDKRVTYDLVCSLSEVVPKWDR